MTCYQCKTLKKILCIVYAQWSKRSVKVLNMAKNARKVKQITYMIYHIICNNTRCGRRRQTSPPASALQLHTVCIGTRQYPNISHVTLELLLCILCLLCILGLRSVMPLINEDWLIDWPGTTITDTTEYRFVTPPVGECTFLPRPCQERACSKLSQSIGC